jgi:hypothetical protein
VKNVTVTMIVKICDSVTVTVTIVLKVGVALDALQEGKTRVNRPKI